MEGSKMYGLEYFFGKSMGRIIFCAYDPCKGMRRIFLKLPDQSCFSLPRLCLNL